MLRYVSVERVRPLAHRSLPSSIPSQLPPSSQDAGHAPLSRLFPHRQQRKQTYPERRMRETTVQDATDPPRTTIQSEPATSPRWIRTRPDRRRQRPPPRTRDSRPSSPQHLAATDPRPNPLPARGPLAHLPVQHGAAIRYVFRDPGLLHPGPLAAAESADAGATAAAAAGPSGVRADGFARRSGDGAV